MDTALLGNAKGLELAIEYFGHDRVLFGTDAPLGILPAGPSQEIIQALDSLQLPEEISQKIYYHNITSLI